MTELHDSLPSDSNDVQTFRFACRCCAALLIFGGTLVLAGWIWNRPFLRGGFSAGITVKTNTAICLLLAGAALAQLPPSRKEQSLWLARIPGFLVACIGGLTWTEHLFGWNLGIDELLFREPPGMPGTSSPNRMGLPASICFTLIGSSILLLTSRAPARRHFSQYLAMIVAVLAFLPCLGYAYGVSEMYGIAGYTAVSFPTAVLILVAVLGVLCADPTGPLVSLTTAPTVGGVLVRRLLLPAVAAPTLLGALVIAGGRAELYEPTFGVALLVIALVVVFTVLVWLSGHVLHNLDLARSRAKLAEQQSHKERQRLLESERIARAEAERAGRMKDEFLSTLSHELRTPLNAILGYATLLKLKEMRGCELEEAISTIERNAKLQAQLIEDLLDMNRIISGKIRLEIETMRLKNVLLAALDTVRLSAEARGVVLKLQIDDSLDSIHGDPARIQQVVWNLLSNAIKFTPPGGTVQVSARRAHRHVEISVSDTGEGIEPDFLPCVFDRFRQADAAMTRRHGGLGLGLAIVKHLVELHGGSVSVTSAGKGQGSTFVVSLPVRAREADGALTSPVFSIDHRTLLQKCHFDLEGIRVLVVDDEPDATMLVKRVLERYNAIVDMASSSGQAIERLRMQAYQLLVSDIGMPGEDGYQMLTRIRNEFTMNRDIPAIALTAFARAEDQTRAALTGFQVHLAKPIEARELLAAVANLVHRDGHASMSSG